MPTPFNPKLYEKAKAIADAKYDKPSAYKSGFIVKTYKELGGTYLDDNQPRDLKRWFSEDWINLAKPDEYPVLRPSKIVSSKTPLTVDEISPKKIKEQVKLKQKIKGEKNLPKF
jgi:hypothetical protein